MFLPQAALDLGPRNPLLTQPRQESEMGTRTPFRAGLLVFPPGEGLGERKPRCE